MSYWTCKPKDFEDGAQYFAAQQVRVDYIVTRNKKDFSFSSIPVLTPAEFRVMYEGVNTR